MAVLTLNLPVGADTEAPYFGTKSVRLGRFDDSTGFRVTAALLAFRGTTGDPGVIDPAARVVAVQVVVGEQAGLSDSGEVTNLADETLVADHWGEDGETNTGPINWIPLQVIRVAPVVDDMLTVNYAARPGSGGTSLAVRLVLEPVKVSAADRIRWQRRLTIVAEGE